MSRAGSQVMKRGSKGAERWEEEEGPGPALKAEVETRKFGAEALTRSMIRASLSSSSGQMSGQWVKPK